MKKKLIVDRWESDAFSSKEIANEIRLDIKKKLLYLPHPFSGWRPKPNQKLKTLTINSQGLRSKELNSDKENCVLLGGSVAWGFGASSNSKTICYQIEKILDEKYNIKINVINLAEQMHSSHDELLTFIGWYDEIKPKIIISFSGTNDINQGYKNLFKISGLHTRFINFFNKALVIGLTDENNIFKFVMKTCLRFFKKTENVKSENFEIKKPTSDEIPSHLFKNKIEIINAVTKNHNISTIHCLQPDLIQKKVRSDDEIKTYNFLSKEKVNYVNKHLNLLKNMVKNFNTNNNEPHIKYIDLTKIFDDSQKTIYFDKAHLADLGQKIVAEKISAEIKKLY